MKPQPVAPDQPLTPGTYWIHVIANNAIVQIVRRWPTIAQQIADQMQRQFDGRVTLKSRGLAWIDYGDGTRLYWVLEAIVQPENEQHMASGTVRPMVAAGVVITGVMIVAALALVLGITLTIKSIEKVKYDYCDENPQLCASREQTYRWLAYAAAGLSAAMLLRQLWR